MTQLSKTDFFTDLRFSIGLNNKITMQPVFG